jgi:hypothetical protein
LVYHLEINDKHTIPEYNDVKPITNAKIRYKGGAAITSAMPRYKGGEDQKLGVRS